MSKVKIFLEPGENIASAEAALFKALDFQVSGDVHAEANFADPAVADAVDRMDALHNRVYSDMIREIIQVLDSEYADGN